ncbi:hypothetical protein ACIBQ6_21925 [Nonomuraea sp. NPDC049655]|uniref:hypothetical protein n=1 Tax=Nonomuraea sp. NPDC049655 TaxID=3364355 RepID=UPI0037A24D2D
MADTKTEKTVADELREAAAKLRETAKAAPPGPWGVNGPWWWEVTHYEQDVTSCIVTDPGNEPIAVLAPPYNRHADAEKAAPWIRLVNPLLAEPLASWLEEYARWAKDSIFVYDEEEDTPVHESDHCDGVIGESCQCFAHPLAVARVLNGTAPMAGDSSDGNALSAPHKAATTREEASPVSL